MESTDQPAEKKSFDRNAYMRAYQKRRRQEDPEWREKLAAKKRDHYRGKIALKPEIYGLNNRDALMLRTYYHKLLLLEPDCVAEIILELGLPELPTF
jgi:hypothetical protein